MSEHFAWHYCSVGALKAIVESRKFRLSNVLYMNDYKEVSWLIDMAFEVIAKREPKGDVDPAKLRFLNTYHAMIERLLRRREFDHIYGGCFSTRRDDLSQWRGYADDAKGVAILFDLETIMDENRQLRKSKINYSPEAATRQAEEVLDNCLADIENYEIRSDAEMRGRWAATRLISLAPGYKNLRFESEDEIRPIIHPEDDAGANDKGVYDHSLLDPTALPEGVTFYERNGALIPCTYIPLPLDSIKKVMLGPKLNDHLSEASVTLFLTKHLGMRGVVTKSDASYR